MLVFAVGVTVIAVFADAIADVSMALTVKRPCGSSLALREILREEKRRHECRSDNKREVTAWESSPKQSNRTNTQNNKKNTHNTVQILHIQNTAT